MTESNVRVAVSGASGRMGRELIKCLLLSKARYPSIVLTGAITKPGSKFIGYDVGKLVGCKSVGIIINNSIEAICEDFDILIDFSCSQSTLEYLDKCKLYKKNMVIGTTGFTQEELLTIQSISKYIGIVFSSNFSVMINLMLIFLKRLSSFFKKDHHLDIEILEMHHRNKCDIPSGTALRMREMILSGLSVCKNYSKNIDKSFLESKKDDRKVKINSIRAGETVGEHSVFFINNAERFELTHRAFDREIFANGAIYSAIWLSKKMKVGLFDMIDVLEIDDF